MKTIFVECTVSLREYESIFLDWLIDPNLSRMLVGTLIEQDEKLDFVRLL